MQVWLLFIVQTIVLGQFWLYLFLECGNLISRSFHSPKLFILLISYEAHTHIVSIELLGLECFSLQFFIQSSHYLHLLMRIRLWISNVQNYFALLFNLVYFIFFNIRCGQAHSFFKVISPQNIEESIFTFITFQSTCAALIFL